MSLFFFLGFRIPLPPINMEPDVRRVLEDHFPVKGTGYMVIGGMVVGMTMLCAEPNGRVKMSGLAP